MRTRACAVCGARFSTRLPILTCGERCRRRFGATESLVRVIESAQVVTFRDKEAS